MKVMKPETESDRSVELAESIVAFNVKLRLSAMGKTQKELGDALGVKNTTVSMKLSGRTAWSLADLVRAAAFLGTTPETLMDDSIMNAMGMKAPTTMTTNDTETKNAGDNAGEECPGCDSNARHPL